MGWCKNCCWQFDVTMGNLRMCTICVRYKKVDYNVMGYSYNEPVHRSYCFSFQTAKSNPYFIYSFVTVKMKCAGNMYRLSTYSIFYYLLSELNCRPITMINSWTSSMQTNFAATDAEKGRFLSMLAIYVYLTYLTTTLMLSSAWL